MKKKIEILEKKFDDELKIIKDSEKLEKLRVKFLGKKGSLTSLFADLKNIQNSEKKIAGNAINHFKDYVLKNIKEKKDRIKEIETKKLIENAKTYDVSRPSKINKGSYHPITLIQRKIEEIFLSMGFVIEDFPEMVTDYECFESLNIPKTHPARDMQDTYYLNNGKLLKTQTSAAQNTIMKKYGVPLRAIFPGRCFRNEATDACHENTFFQLEGLMIAKSVSISNLIYFMKTLLSKVFEKDVKVRLRPGFFPFVEPGFELDINCLICGGNGCTSCKYSGWLEILPCGMIHPNVLKMGEINSEKYNGFAFGLGLTRLAMMKYQIKDIRDFNSGNLKSLSQFTSI